MIPKTINHVYYGHLVFSFAFLSLLGCPENPHEHEFIILGQGSASHITDSGYIVVGDQAVWSEEYGLQLVPSRVTDINEMGNGIGDYPDEEHYTVQAFFWNYSTGIQLLGTLGGHSSWASAINDTGQVVGYSHAVQPAGIHAFLWDQDGGMRDLGTLGGVHSEATAINNTGQVAGYSSVSSEEMHAFIWDEMNGMQDLGPVAIDYAFLKCV